MEKYVCIETAKPSKGFASVKVLLFL